MGHEITFHWTKLPMMKPYDEHEEEAKKLATAGIQGVVDADVYIIFVHKDGNGVYTEFGAALASNVISGTPTIYAIGNDKSAAMFNYHPSVQWKKDIESVLEEVSKT